MPVFLQRLAGLPALLLAAGCACGGVGPAGFPGSLPPPFTMPALVPGPGIDGATISRPGFEGGAFSSVLPVRARPAAPAPAEVLAEIEPVLRAVGFRRSLSDLAGPDEPLRLAPPDLRSLSVEVCREAALREAPSSRALCEALSGGGQPSLAADAAIRNAYGEGYLEWKSGLERLSFQYPFTQRVAGVPIDGAGVSVFLREGEGLALVHGSLFDRFTVVNLVRPGRRDALMRAALALFDRLPGDRKDGGNEDRALPVQAREPDLVLVPDGTVRQGRADVPALRYAWRALVGLPGGRGSLMVWVDADRGGLLRVAGQSKDAVSVGMVRWRRDPGLCKTSPPCTQTVQVEVDDPQGDRLTLRLAGVFEQVENRVGPDLEAQLSLGGFNRPPANDAATALCALQGNTEFRQVNVYSHLYSLWKTVGSAGIVPAFPERPVRVVVDYTDDSGGNSAHYDSEAGKGDARSSLWFGDGRGFRDGSCPDAGKTRLSGSQDATIPIHEMSHLLVQRLQERRPADWCCTKCKSCPLPDSLGHNILHDFADSFAFAYASTNCFAGWNAKNMDGTDANLDCKAASEAGGFPRKAELPQDRFPEHRAIHQGEYANGQIAAAGLWEVRKGLRSKALAAGTDEYWVRLLRSLWDFGTMASTCSYSDFYPGTTRLRYNSCDRDVFLYLQDLERRMVGEWVVAGPPAGQTVGKVLSGWAKAGIYLVPFHCLDGRLDTNDPVACPKGKVETALDAVIEIDDRDAGDDLVVDGVTHPEVDYLQPDGPPGFQVWTGPHYRFAADGTALLSGPPPCGDRFQVELAADPGFKKVVWTGKGTVAPGQPCTGQVLLSPGDWKTVQGGLTEARVYYRARTWDAAGRERLSTSPGGGAFQVAPPFAAITADGKP